MFFSSAGLCVCWMTPQDTAFRKPRWRCAWETAWLTTEPSHPGLSPLWWVSKSLETHNPTDTFWSACLLDNLNANWMHIMPNLCINALFLTFVQQLCHYRNKLHYKICDLCWQNESQNWVIFIFAFSIKTLQMMNDLLESDKKCLNYTRLKSIKYANSILRKIELQFSKGSKAKFPSFPFLIIITILINHNIAII